MVSFAQQLVAHRGFQRLVIAMILLAGVLAGLETSAGIMAAHGRLLHRLDQVVLAVFVVEIALKLLACGRAPWRYFNDGWNLFDFLIVVLCFLPGGGSFASVVRLARVFRLLRLVHALPKLQLLVGALLKSLAAMGYVSLLLALMFYIYAVAGVHLFGASDADFGSLPVALLTLFRVVTLDNWGDFFSRALEHASAWLVTAYFVSFIVLGTMIILNLFIGIVMNSMAETHKELEAGAGHPAPALEEELAALETQLAAAQRRLQALRGTLAAPTEKTGPAPPA